jgi:2-keto-4-pentenoate hydratase/2-oxohepta-3-ene-1,7-dioic acid hydratase in catechol pathway
MPFVEVFTREKLSDEVRAKLAEELSNTVMTVEVGGPTESAKMIDWMWFHTMPADSWVVGGRFEQQGNTSDMLFPVYEMLAYLSRHMRMVPGDILATGTPPGVGMAKNRFLTIGDILECGITNLGAQRHQIVA